jgi:hypothetical protein
MEFKVVPNSGLAALIIASPLLIALLAFLFKKVQNQKAFVGGDISTPKSLWLSYTVISWFLFPFVFLFLDINSPLKILVQIHLISFWVRGLIELVMIYKLFNWSPRYGISHSAAHALLLLLGTLYVLTQKPTSLNLNELVVLTFLISIFICVCFEVLFAVLFFNIRSKGTYEEEHKVYFASDEPQWRRVNDLTKVALFFGLGAYAISAGLLLS